MNNPVEPARKNRPRRDREKTRAAILAVTARLLAEDGPEGLSVSQVAQRAGVNRGTAYHHFATREQLLKETTAWISENLCQEVFGVSSLEHEEAPFNPGLPPGGVTERLARFAMDNPELARAWLFEILSSKDPHSDPFWRLYLAQIKRFVQSDRAEPGIDAEVYAMMQMVGAFMWPVWAQSDDQSPRMRRKLAKRFSSETLRMSLHGVLRGEFFPELTTDA